MQDRFKFRIPMFTDKGTFMEFQYLELGDFIECTLCGTNGEPQQCTGLKDKNGKLIYEGDILKIELGGYPKHFVNEAVIWDRKRWVLAKKRNCKGTPKECQHCIHCERIEARKEWFFQTNDTNFKSFYTNEVIGNIYENPELLGVSNGY